MLRFLNLRRYHRIERFDEILQRLDRMERKIMATLTDLQAAVTAENTEIDSAIALLQGLAQKIADLSPDQAAIDALAAEVTAKTQALADAVVANTPAAPPAVPPDTAPP